MSFWNLFYKSTPEESRVALIQKIAKSFPWQRTGSGFAAVPVSFMQKRRRNLLFSRCIDAKLVAIRYSGSMGEDAISVIDPELEAVINQLTGLSAYGAKMSTKPVAQDNSPYHNLLLRLSNTLH